MKTKKLIKIIVYPHGSEQTHTNQWMTPRVIFDRGGNNFKEYPFTIRDNNRLIKRSHRLIEFLQNLEHDKGINVKTKITYKNGWHLIDHITYTIS